MTGPPKTHVTKLTYVLSQTNGPGAKITHVTLKGSNYEEWAKGFRVGLGAKRKLGFIDGKLKRPADDSEDLEDWMTVNFSVIQWIFNTIEPTLRSTISYRDTSFELWEDIMQHFLVGNTVKIYQLESDISDCKQKPGETIMEYYGRLKKLWEDVNDYDALPSCTCSGCKCGLSVTLRTRRELRQTRTFLMGLEPFYATARSSILGVEPLPSLHSVYCHIVHEEEMQTITQKQVESSPAMAFAVRGNDGPGSKQGHSRFVCTHCSKTGHTEDRCWEKYGYKGRAPKREGDGAGAGTSSAGLAAAVRTVSSETTLEANFARLNGKLNTTWIVDTGASTHVYGLLALFDHYAIIRPLEISLPNGNRLKATHKGTLRINDSLILHDVLYVPGFTCSLLSISQLLLNQKLNIEFSHFDCVIQDHILMTMIGVGKLVDGLYLLAMDESERVNVVQGTGNIELWHKRLGHPSLQAMELLP
ncbi:hypothetical protein vseg_005343 [Gypsophila vaccaria]